MVSPYMPLSLVQAKASPFDQHFALFSQMSQCEGYCTGILVKIRSNFRDTKGSLFSGPIICSLTDLPKFKMLK